jgi:hypothetical protein
MNVNVLSLIKAGIAISCSPVELSKWQYALALSASPLTSVIAMIAKA